jgi:hypothetical protein
MNWIFWAFVGAEEFVYPGGFLDSMKRINPRFAPAVTVKFAIAINALLVLLCLVAAILASRIAVFSLSVASLLFVNTLLHIAETFRTKRYAPGLISGLLLYTPLSLYAYYIFANSGQLTLLEGLASGLLGVLYYVVPVGYVALSSVAKGD